MAGFQRIGLQERTYLADVSDPLIIVINGSNRSQMINNPKEPPYSSGVHVLESYYRRLLLYAVLTFAVAGSMVHFLLPEKGQDEGPVIDETRTSHLKIDILGPVHDMDIIMLTGSAKGVIASVGLDRQIRVWRLSGQLSCAV